MGLKFKYRDLWYHGKLVPKRVYEQLEDLQKQIDEQHIVKEDVENC